MFNITIFVPYYRVGVLGRMTLIFNPVLRAHFTYISSRSVFLWRPVSSNDHVIITPKFSD